MALRGFSIRAGPVLAVVLLSSTSGCTKDRGISTGPTAPFPRLAAASTTPGTYFYYQGQPIPLDVDSSGIVVASALAAPQVEIGHALSTGITRVPQMPDHWLVHLPGVSGPAFSDAIANLRRDTLFTFVSQRFRVHQDRSLVIPLNRLLVQPKAGITRASVDSLAKALGMSIVRDPNPEQGFLWFTLSYPPRQSPLEVAAALHNNPLVQLAEPDFVTDRRAMLVPNNPYYPLQYYLKNTLYLNGVRVDDNVEAAWDLTTGSGVRVAVIDQGIDGTHPQLCGGAHSPADGYDAFAGIFPGEDAWHPNPKTIIDMHGTEAAGIIAACLNNGAGTAGIAPSVTLISVRIFRDTFPAANADAAAAINWAWSTAHADVLNNSWGGGAPSDVVTNAINAAASQGRGGLGAAVIFSAGNTSKRHLDSIGAITYPAWLSSVLAVGAIDSAGRPADYTPRDPMKIGMVAPSGSYAGLCVGSVVTLAFYLNNRCWDGPNGDRSYTTRFSGTSAAAPQVAGAAALLLALNPTMSWGTAAGRIAVNSDYWGAPNDFGKGKLNIHHVLVPVAPPLSVTISGPWDVRPYALCTWTAHASGGVAPYAYSWIPSGTQVDSMVTESFAPASGPYTLTVVVTDAVNTQTQNIMRVYVSTTYPICRQ